MGPWRRGRGSVRKTFVDGDVVPAKNLIGVKVIDHRQRVQFVQSRNNSAVFDLRQPANAEYEFGTSPPCRQLVAGALYFSIRQSQSLADLPQTKTWMHG